jgi:hypothetical protein
VARIIDPDAWERRASLLREMAAHDDRPGLACLADKAVEDSLAKAEAVIAASDAWDGGLRVEVARLTAENERLRATLSNLVWLKDHKDRNGKDSVYRTVQPAAWAAALAVLAQPGAREGEGWVEGEDSFVGPAAEWKPKPQGDAEGG